ncbi:uncharacterized protein LOC124648529 [Lolium rigidum]|uniref:uncharacterized protein LOC124648529 n=1 Tax=Lolium rigidum TaxID=89674 RepID=UPI001F5DB722|nr:uncharacterized protein LOC124648529 [Lolium rigidum]
MQSAVKRFAAFFSATPTVPQLQACEELPDELLHLIISLLCFFRDLLAFAATCHSWRAAFSSYPSKSTFCSVCPPLLVKLVPSAQAPHDDRKLRTCKVIDPANENTTLHCQIPQEALDNSACYHACYSYGQLICYRREYFCIVDVFTSAEVSSPPLPLSSNDCHKFFYCAILTAPLASRNSHLLISTRLFLYDWLVGSDSWSELSLSERLHQIVHHDSQFIAMDSQSSLYTLQLAPRLSLQKLITKQLDNLTASAYSPPWIVVCGDMLVMVKNKHAFRLDMSAKPAEWVEVKLGNWALFESGDVRSPVFSCINPERWGGWSSRLYHAHSPHPLILPWHSPWIVLKLGSYHVPRQYSYKKWFRALQAIWVYPSMFCADGQ